MTSLTLNLPHGSVAFDCPLETAQALKSALSELIGRLKTVANEAASGTKVTPQPPLEYRSSGNDLFFEIFCNPNIYPTPFAAKVLITLKDTHIRLSTEADLSQLIEDVNQFLGE
jgi:hypothetical protein